MNKLIPALAATALFATAAIAQSPQAPQPIGATRAVAIAEKALSARALEADLDIEKGQMVYEVELVRGGALYEARIDAMSGTLLSQDKKRMESVWAGWFDKDKLAKATQPLSATLAALEAETGGTVEEVGFDTDNGRAVYEVELTTNAGTAEIAIDAATGKRLPAAFAD
ncbi:MAG: PepSY domain-containing protein [Sphingomonadaceae bacterium]|nr:PepSY domain-containing protein [Sphingomonadaceae bacterium]